MRQHKILPLVIAVLLIACSAACVYAADEKATAAADVLYDLGLFAGTGTNADGTPIYSLDRQLNRQEAMTLFINLLGKGEEAMEGSWTTPFTDVDDWAKPFIGYAYEHDFTAGVAADRFGAHDPVTEDQYMTYLLLALGYEQGADFQWNEAAAISGEIGFDDSVFHGGPFTRAQAVLCNCNALALPQKENADSLLGAFEGKPADAEYVAADNGFLFAWNEGGKAVVAQYGTDLSLTARYEAQKVETRYDGLKKVHVLLHRYEDVNGSSFGYYCGMAGLYRMQDGKLQQLSSRPVAQMIFLRYGAAPSGPVILTFPSNAPVYSEMERFGGDTILEIREDGTEDVFLHGNTGHGIEIDKIYAADSTVHFSAVKSMGMGSLYGYDYALLRQYVESTGKYKPVINVLSYEPYPEEAGLEPGTAAYDKYTRKMWYEEQKRLKELGLWGSNELPPEEF